MPRSATRSTLTAYLKWNVMSRMTPSCSGGMTLGTHHSHHHSQTWSWSRKRHQYMTTKAAAQVPPEPSDSTQYVLRTVGVAPQELVSLHFRHPALMVDVPACRVLEDRSLFMPTAPQGLYHLDQLSATTVDHQGLKEGGLHMTVREYQADKTNPGTNIESVMEYQWRQQKVDLNKLSTHYKMLSKHRLTGLVVLTTMAGYAIAPGPFELLPFALCTLGTALTSCAANSMNQYFEIPYDCQMNRTKNRVLVQGLLSPLHAVGFASVCSVTGLAMLSLGVNSTVAALGAFNLGLYTLCYTPLKRVSIVNTWLGAVVGAVPPLMGWAACTGSLDMGALLVGGLLFSWQFPHFNALSWNLRPDYSRAGYRMMAVVNPGLCQRVALRHCIYLTAMCLAAPAVGVTTWTFAADSLPLNLYFTYLAWRFYRQGDSNSSRKLFRFSLIHIPVLLLLMIISKASFGSHNKAKPVEVASEEAVTSSV